MRIPESPCLDCKKRRVGCHATCKAYKEYECAQKEYREHVTKQKMEENELIGIEIQRFKK